MLLLMLLLMLLASIHCHTGMSSTCCHGSGRSERCLISRRLPLRRASDAAYRSTSGALKPRRGKGRPWHGTLTRPETPESP
eukprot:12944392-Alexandrium_andersonii.AAC.1